MSAIRTTAEIVESEFEATPVREGLILSLKLDAGRLRTAARAIDSAAGRMGVPSSVRAVMHEQAQKLRETADCIYKESETRLSFNGVGFSANEKRRLEKAWVKFEDAPKSEALGALGAFNVMLRQAVGIDVSKTS